MQTLRWHVLHYRLLDESSRRNREEELLVRLAFGGILSMGLVVGCNGGLRHDDDCPMDCRSVCGDGVRSELEACDDGNQVDGDGCSAQCELP